MRTQRILIIIDIQAAERAASKYITGAVYHSKRLIGRPYTDDLQREREQLHWPFGVVDRSVR